jgi:hypothetical protein
VIALGCKLSAFCVCVRLKAGLGGASCLELSISQSNMASDALSDHFATLGLEPNSQPTLCTVKSAYKALALKHHPDKNGGTRQSGELFKKMNTAYVTILNSPRFGGEAIKDGGAHGLHESTTDAPANTQVFDDSDDLINSVKINMDSITIELSPDRTEVWIQACQDKYGAPTIQGNQHGLKFSSPISLQSEDDHDSVPRGSVHITIYKTTNRMLVQGSSYLLWYGDEFLALCSNVRSCTVTSTANAPARPSLISAKPSSNPKKTTNKLDPQSDDPQPDVTSSCRACPDTDNESMLLCDKCNRWLHFQCTGLSDIDLAPLISNHSFPFICTFCMSTSEEIKRLKSDLMQYVSRIESSVVSALKSQIQVQSKS